MAGTHGCLALQCGRTDAVGLPIIEQVKRDNSTAYVEHDPVTGEPLILRTSSGLASLYIFDGTGNPAALITSGAYTAFAYTYDPYGVPTLTKDSGGNGKTQNPYTFKQGLQDRSTGWVKYGARWYDPTTGRWTQQDTLDAPLDPRNANRYAFAANDPINNSDPLGLATDWADVGKATLGGAIAIGFTAAFAGTVAASCAVTVGLTCIAVGAGVAGLSAGVGASTANQVYGDPADEGLVGEIFNGALDGIAGVFGG